jgi:hypothetical protein
MRLLASIVPKLGEVRRRHGAHEELAVDRIVNDALVHVPGPKAVTVELNEITGDVVGGAGAHGGGAGSDRCAD